MQSIPVIIISGFLGSGKTTLLLRLMKDARQRQLQFGVLMNELGQADVDGSMLRGDGGDFPLEKLFDGCLCCDKKSEIADSLLLLVKRNPDVIFIELTGVANPEEIADSLTEPRLRHIVALKRIVTVLDAELTLEYNSIFSADKQLVHTLRRQMETADIILLNKTDLVKTDVADKVLKTVRKHNQTALPVLTSFAQLDNKLLLHDVEPMGERLPQSPMPRFQVRTSHSMVAEKRRPSSQSVHGEGQVRSYSRLQTLCLNGKPEGLLTRKQIESFVKMTSGQLIRAKGYIRCKAHAPLSLYQFAGKRMNWEESQFTGEPYLVLIGIDLNEEAIRSAWERLIMQPT